MPSTMVETIKRKVAVTISFEQKGTQPPLYVAGSFTEPRWEPLVMDDTLAPDGEHCFSKKVEVEEKTEYQYKFRTSSGDWVLDKSAPTAIDESGNKNNVLTAPVATPAPEKPLGNMETQPETVKENGSDLDPKPVTPEDSMPSSHVVVQLKADKISLRDQTQTLSSQVAAVASEVADSARLLDPDEPEQGITDEEAGKIGLRRLSQTPIPEVAKTAAEVADTARLIDVEEDASDIVSDTEAGKLGLRRLSQTPLPEVAQTAAEVADTAATLDTEDTNVTGINGTNKSAPVVVPPPETKRMASLHERTDSKLDAALLEEAETAQPAKSDLAAMSSPSGVDQEDDPEVIAKEEEELAALKAKKSKKRTPNQKKRLKELEDKAAERAEKLAGKEPEPSTASAESTRTEQQIAMEDHAAVEDTIAHHKTGGEEAATVAILGAAKESSPEEQTKTEEPKMEETAAAEQPLAVEEEVEPTVALLVQAADVASPEPTVKDPLAVLEPETKDSEPVTVDQQVTEDTTALELAEEPKTKAVDDLSEPDVELTSESKEPEPAPASTEPNLTENIAPGTCPDETKADANVPDLEKEDEPEMVKQEPIQPAAQEEKPEISVTGSGASQLESDEPEPEVGESLTRPQPEDPEQTDDLMESQPTVESSNAETEPQVADASVHREPVDVQESDALKGPEATQELPINEIDRLEVESLEASKEQTVPSVTKDAPEVVEAAMEPGDSKESEVVHVSKEAIPEARISLVPHALEPSLEEIRAAAPRESEESKSPKEVANVEPCKEDEVPINLEPSRETDAVSEPKSEATKDPQTTEEVLEVHGVKPGPAEAVEEEELELELEPKAIKKEPEAVEEEEPEPEAVKEQEQEPVEEPESEPKTAEERGPERVEEEKPEPKAIEKDPEAVKDQKLVETVEEPEPKPIEVEEKEPEAKTVEEEKPEPEAKPVEEEKPEPEAKPVEEEKPEPEAKPVEEEKPEPEAKPVEEEKPEPEAKPVEEEKPESEAKPVAEAKPVEEEKPEPEAKAVEEEKPEPEPKAVEEKPEPKAVEEKEPEPEPETKTMEEEKPEPEPKSVEEEEEPEPEPEPVEEKPEPKAVMKQEQELVETIEEPEPEPKAVEEKEPEPEAKAVEEEESELVEEEKPEPKAIEKEPEAIKDQKLVETVEEPEPKPAGEQDLKSAEAIKEPEPEPAATVESEIVEIVKEPPKAAELAPPTKSSVVNAAAEEEHPPITVATTEQPRSEAAGDVGVAGQVAVEPIKAIEKLEVSSSAVPLAVAGVGLAGSAAAVASSKDETFQELEISKGPKSIAMETTSGSEQILAREVGPVGESKPCSSSTVEAPKDSAEASGESAPVDTSKAAGAGTTSTSEMRQRKGKEPETTAEVSAATSEVGANQERALAPPPVHKGFFNTFFRALFIDWIGGFLSRCFGGRRNGTLVAVCTIAVAGVAWWKGLFRKSPID